MTTGLPEDYGALFERESSRLWRAVYAFAHDQEIASDAVAESFAQCIRRGDLVRSPERWIWRAAFRIAAGELQRRRQLAELSQEPHQDAPDQDGPVIAALRELSPQQPAAVVLIHFVGYDARSVGQILDCSTATARVHASRGRRKLRTLLEAQGD